jgi:hypothetical protein
MGRPPSAETRVRLSLDVGRTVKDRVERIQRLMGAESITEVVRRALAFYEVMLDIFVREHGRLILRYPNGPRARDHHRARGRLMPPPPPEEEIAETDRTLLDDVLTILDERPRHLSDEDLTRQITVLWSIRRDERLRTTKRLLAGAIYDILDGEWSRRHPFEPAKKEGA